MSKIRHASAVTSATAALLACSPAMAAQGPPPPPPPPSIMRVWVSGHGVDQSGCGTPAAPCRSLQYAEDAISAGGEIDILDPAGYGAVTITKAVSIVNDGVGTAGVQQSASGQSAITISAGATDTVTLRGLNIDGLGLAKDGVHVASAGGLTIVNCIIRHFTHDGVYVVTSDSESLAITGSTASDNGNDGFDLSPSGVASLNGFVESSLAFNNGSNGISIWGANTTNIPVTVAVSNSNTSDNGNDGIYNFGPVVDALVNDGAYNNALYGFDAEGTAVLTLAKSSAMGFNQICGLATGPNTLAVSYGGNAITNVASGSGTTCENGNMQTVPLS